MTATVTPRSDVLERPSFPDRRYRTASDFGSAYLAESARAAQTIDPTALERAAQVLHHAYLGGQTVYSCGNGGSAAVADHLQCDHLKGVRTGTDLVPRVTSLASNVDLITAIANDIGYEEVFAYQLASQGHPGDVLVAISSSGQSPNIRRTLEWARSHDIRTIALTGFDGGTAKRLSDISIHVTCRNYGIVEDVHQAAMHTLAQFIRHLHIGASAVASTQF